MVGKPETSKRSARGRWRVASTVATTTFSSGTKMVASSSYVASKALQCAHHGAKNSTSTALAGS